MRIRGTQRRSHGTELLQCLWWLWWNAPTDATCPHSGSSLDAMVSCVLSLKELSSSRNDALQDVAGLDSEEHSQGVSSKVTPAGTCS